MSTSARARTLARRGALYESDCPKIGAAFEFGQERSGVADRFDALHRETMDVRVGELDQQPLRARPRPCTFVTEMGSLVDDNETYAQQLEHGPRWVSEEIAVAHVLHRVRACQRARRQQIQGRRNDQRIFLECWDVEVPKTEEAVIVPDLAHMAQVIHDHPVPAHTGALSLVRDNGGNAPLEQRPRDECGLAAQNASDLRVARGEVGIVALERAVDCETHRDQARDSEDPGVRGCGDERSAGLAAQPAADCGCGGDRDRRNGQRRRRQDRELEVQEAQRIHDGQPEKVGVDEP